MALTATSPFFFLFSFSLFFLCLILLRSLLIHNVEYDKQSSTFFSSYPFNGREESGMAFGPIERERVELNDSYGGSTSQRVYSSNSQNSADMEEKVQKVSPPRRKMTREEKPGNWTKKDGGGSELSTQNTRQTNSSNHNNTNNVGHQQNDPELHTDVNINAILEEEEALVAAHRKEIEDTMEIVRESDDYCMIMHCI